MQKCPEIGSINPIITSYGCAGFHFCYYDYDKILQYCDEYISSEKKREIEELLMSGEPYFLEDEIDRETFRKIVRDHPDVIAGGLVQIVFSIADFKVDYEADLEEAIKKLEWNLQRLKELKKFLENKLIEDYEISYEVLELGENDYDLEEVEGLTVYITLYFEAEKTIADLEEEIDKLITPMKKYFEGKPRYDLYLRR